MQHRAQLFIFYALSQLLADSSASHKTFFQAYPDLSRAELVLCFYLTPFLGANLALRCCAAQRVRGRETKKECASWKGNLSSEWTEARFMKNEGRAEDGVKVCLGDGESEGKSDREIKEVKENLQ